MMQARLAEMEEAKDKVCRTLDCTMAMELIWLDASDDG